MINLKKISYRLLLTGLIMPIGYAFSQSSAIKKIQNLNAADKMAYFNFEKGTEVNEADTAKTGWDISFQHTGIIVQGAAEGQIVSDASFDKIDKAPASGYKKGKQAIPWGSGNGWYTYNMDNHQISPIPGKVIFIHTAAGKFYKLIIDSYYKDGPDGASANYTFRYSAL
ncbi:HmuY family protein [Mucilaginibacter sp. cycad4]|uniref:HmuY family protein n=1 Tax=Mucilaginibacter sp. cycad4 TaxID=3342096 RepID=UPI002AAB30A7|nr:HmuY family protein [Mucilaginibacter gossypii]WPV01770.1 HmuY family protein [Mucilaginibacter gossypii]